MIDQSQVRNLVSDLAILTNRPQGDILTPDRIPNIVGWWDFTDLSTITANSSNQIATINDKTGTNNLTATTKPTIKFDGGNGFPCANFGLSQNISKTFAQALPFTIYLYVRNNIGPNTSVVVGFQTTYQNSILYLSNGAMQIAAGSNFYYGAGQGARFKGNKWTLYRFSLDVSGNAYASIDNEMIWGNLAAFGPGVAGTNPITKLTFGDNVSGTASTDQDLAEVVLISGQPSLSDDAKIRAYFFNKYQTTFTNTLYGLGDSVTYGQAASDAAHTFLYLTAAGMNADYYNLGTPGTTLGFPATIGANTNGTALVNQLDFRDTNAYFLIEYGINDAQGTNANWIAMYEALVQILIDKGIQEGHIGLCSTTYDSGHTAAYTAANTAIEAVATAKGVRYINYYSVLQSNGIDATHPPDAGHALMATTILTAFGF